MRKLIERNPETAGPIRYRALIFMLGVLMVVSSLSANETYGTAVTPPPANSISGNFEVVASGPGDQINPHVSCNLASYTNSTGAVDEVHYFDFVTGSDDTIPGVGLDFLSDVSGSLVAYTNVTGAGSQIAVYDTAQNTNLVIPGGTQRTNPSIGGTLVAFEDRSFSMDPSQGEIVVYDIGTGTTTRLTNNSLMDVNPRVSPNGKVVVFQECQTNGHGCDIYESTQTAQGWSTSAITATGADYNTNYTPSTDGSTVVYASSRNGETDIYYQPVGGGPETQLSIPGDQRYPTISGNLISFESQVGTEYDLFVYDIGSGNLYQVTDTPVDETLNDISVCNGVGRIVYSAPGPNGDFDVFAFTFQPPSSTVNFASFTGKLDVTRSSGTFDLNGAFSLGASSNGINPVAENLTLKLGSYSAAIPPGSFTFKKGAYAFQGTIAGVPLQIRINSTGGRSYTIQAQASGANLSGLSNPVAVTLTIGDDSGTAQLNAQLS